jgi:hypothetical protein
MRRGTGVLLLVAGAMALALAATRVPDALAEVEAFRVTAIELQGERYVALEDLEGHLGDVLGRSVWDDPDPLARRVEMHPLVREARVRRRFPSTLVVHLVEREPVALIPTPALVPLDREGRRLPLDPAVHRMDLPLVQPVREPWSEGISLTPSEIGLLAGEAHRLRELDPALLASASELALTPGGDILIRMGEPRITLLYRTPVPTSRLRQGLRVLADARDRRPDEAPLTIDLRFDDQVVVRFANPNRR